MKAHSVQNYIMSESKTSNWEYMFLCMNWVVVMIAKRTVVVYKPKMRTNKRKILKGFKKEFFYSFGPRINEKCGQTCSNWQHLCPLCGEQFIIRTTLLNLKFTCKFLNLIWKRLKFTWKIWISFGNIWKSFGHFLIWAGNWLNVYERGSLINLLTLLLIVFDSKPKALEILLKLGVKENMKKSVLT